MLLRQQTLASVATVSGTGIHTGQRAVVRLHPAAAGSGRVFRTDRGDISADVENVSDTRRCTTISRGDAKASTVEHLLAALFACQVDNVLIELEGPEVPILDGSARPFVDAVLAAGIEEQAEKASLFGVSAAVAVSEGASRAIATPSVDLCAEAVTEFDDWPEGSATVRWCGDLEEYHSKFDSARTFAFRAEVEQLLSAGLARGGSLDNALVISPPSEFSSPLRMPAEWCTHKLTDVIGDLGLLNCRIAAAVRVYRPGHRINTVLAGAMKLHLVRLDGE